MAAQRTKVFVDIVTKAQGGTDGGLLKYAAAAGAAAVAVGLLVKVGKEWSAAGSRAEEIGSKYATVFRDMSDGAESVASSFANNFDLAESTTKELLGTTGDLLTGLGFTQQGAMDLSEKVNTLAVDLASFSNYEGGAKGASEALTKALLGESEMAKGLGIVINQNTAEYKDAIKYYTEVEGKTLLQAKAYTALQFATEQSGNAIGDYARTSESTANVMRRFAETQTELKEVFGASVNEGVTPFVSALEKVVRQMVDGAKEARALKEALNIVDAGGMTNAAQTLLILEDQRDFLGQIAASYEGMDEKANTAYENAKRNVEAYNESLGMTDSFLIKATDSEARRAGAIEANAKAISEYADLVKSRMTDEEKRLIVLQNEIDLLVQAKAESKAYGTDWIGIETLLVDKLNEKNDLLKETPELLEENGGIIEELTEKNIAYEATEADINQLIADREQLRMVETSRALNGTDEIIDKNEELKMSYEDLASDGLGAFTAAFKDVGEGNKTLMEGLKDGAKDAISAMLEMYAKLWLAQAVASAAGFNFVSAAGYTAAAAGAYAASGVVQSFATGGDFTANEPTLIRVGEQGQENVKITPTSGNSGGSERVFAIVDGNDGFWMTIQRGINNRNLTSNTGAAL